MHSLIAPAIVDNLPSVLKEGVNRLVDDNDRLVFLVSALSIISGVLPNVHGHYGGKWIHPNLYAFIVGGYGTGKGAMSYARNLIEPIEELIEVKNEELRANFEEQDKKDRKHAHPLRIDLVLPGDITDSMLAKKLSGNAEYGIGEFGILYATEADVIATKFKTESGNYSAKLRSYFHHEDSSKMLKGEYEHMMLRNPRMSALISGTPDQLQRIIPDPLNGLFSRFLYLTILAEEGWRDPFDRTKASYEDEFRKLGEEVLNMFVNLLPRTASRSDSEASPQSQPVEFTFSSEQQQQFNEYYSKHKKSFLSDTGEETAGVYHRLALINFRVAMVLACLREYALTDSFPDVLVCTDTDYKVAKAITDILTEETKRIYYTMPEITGDNFDEQLHPKANDCFWYDAQGLSVRKIAALIGMSKSTVGRIINGPKPDKITKPILLGKKKP
jgi:hypothetical protein